MMSCCPFLVLPFLIFFTYPGTTTPGAISLWSDSECNSKSSATSNFGEQDPIALNFTLDTDICGIPGATVHSYQLTQSATCANGSTATFQFYDSNNCTVDPTDENPHPGLASSSNSSATAAKVERRDGGVTGYLDTCLALIAFNSLAFVCEGVPYNKIKTNSALTSTAAATSTGFPAQVLPSGSGGVASSNSSSNNRSATTTSAPLPSSDHGSKSTLSSGASAGVGVGSAVAVLGVAALLFWCFRKWVRVDVSISKRGDGRGSEQRQPELAGHDPPPYESDANEVAHEAGAVVPSESGGNAVHEVGGGNGVVEIAGQR